MRKRRSGDGVGVGTTLCAAVSLSDLFVEVVPGMLQAVSSSNSNRIGKILKRILAFPRVEDTSLDFAPCPMIA